MMIVHHLNNSRSQRILWLLEEIGVPYEIRHYQRDAVTNLAPPALKAVHPLGKSPMLEENGDLIVESAAIVEYLCARHAPQMIPDAGSAAYLRHMELMHFAEGSAMIPILLQLYVGRLREAGAPLHPRIKAELGSHFDYMESVLRPLGHFVLDDLSAADIMLSFPAEIAVARSDGTARPKLAAFVKAMHDRPAWQRALEKSGPYHLA